MWTATQTKYKNLYLRITTMSKPSTDWFRQSFSVGNIVTVIVVILTTAFSIGATYSVIDKDIEANALRNNKQDDQISEVLNVLNNHIVESSKVRFLSGDDIQKGFVTKDTFDQYRDNLDDRLIRIENRLDRLIDLQIKAMDK